MKPTCELCEELTAALSCCDCCDQLYCVDCVEWIEWDNNGTKRRVSSYCWSQGWVHEVFDIGYLRIKGIISETLINKWGPYK